MGNKLYVGNLAYSVRDESLQTAFSQFGAVTSAKVWPRKAFVKRPGVVEVSIGQPISSAGREPDELMREVEAWIEAEMRRLDPGAYPAAPAAPVANTAAPSGK